MGLAAISLGCGVQASEGRTIYGQPLVPGGTRPGKSPVQVVSVANDECFARGGSLRLIQRSFLWSGFRRRGTACSAPSR